jgi:NADH-quinone oxidoreductase subunit C
MSRRALERLKERFGEGVLAENDFRGDETAIIDGALLKDVCRFLRDDPPLKFKMLVDATAVDYLGYPGRSAPRFEVVYHLYSLTEKQRLRLKVQLSEKEPELDSLVELWPIANWLEREIWDLYGVRFRGHPDLRRILMYEEFVGHPLRKDYPKEKSQPLLRRPQSELDEVMERRGRAIALTPEAPAPSSVGIDADHQDRR